MYETPVFDKQKLFELLNLNRLMIFIDEAYHKGFKDGLKATPEERAELEN